MQRERRDENEGNEDAVQEFTAENVGEGASPAESVTGLGLMSGGTARSLGDAVAGGQNPAVPGGSLGGLGVSGNVGVMSGILGAGVSGPGTPDPEDIDPDQAEDVAAEVADTDGGMSAGANDKGLGPLGSAERPDLSGQTVKHYDLDDKNARRPIDSKTDAGGIWDIETAVEQTDRSTRQALRKSKK